MCYCWMRNIIIINHDISSLKKISCSCLLQFLQKKKKHSWVSGIFFYHKNFIRQKKLGSSFRDKRVILKSPSVYSLNVKTSHQFHVQVQIWNYKSFYWSKDRLQKEEERVLHRVLYYTSKWFQSILSCSVRPQNKIETLIQFIWDFVLIC